MNKYLIRIIFSLIFLTAWYLTSLLPFISFEYIPGYGSMATDCLSGSDAVGSYIFKDALHFLFIEFGAFLIAILLIISPKWAFNFWIVYMFNLVLGLLGMMFDETLQLCWGWYIHAIVMFCLGWGFYDNYWEEKKEE
jgi:hypothetical protein|tara:strand:- start:172 stop:582 length:411 start_codon:yes stop_codon:yes gene_type:complete